MKARLLFLGTGGDAFVIGKQHRSSGGILFNVEDNLFHIDPGPGSLVMAKMMGQNLRENTAIFVSKNHLFTANDVNAVISAMTHDGLDKRGVIVCPSDVVSDDNKKSYPFVNKSYKNYLEKAIVVDNTRKIAINNVDIEIIELSKPINEVCAFKFITPRFILSYVPDSKFNLDIVETFEDTDILILNVPDSREYKQKDHLNIEDAERIIKKAQPQLAIITGFGIKMLQAEPLYQARELQKNTGIQVIAAKDGMTINPVSFTTTVRQKKLKGY